MDIQAITARGNIQTARIRALILSSLPDGIELLLLRTTALHRRTAPAALEISIGVVDFVAFHNACKPVNGNDNRKAAKAIANGMVKTLKIVTTKPWRETMTRSFSLSTPRAAPKLIPIKLR